ncbi:MAG: Gfo/Idh/MocA family oxidoreductase [Sedimentisphaerales bacterium]|nr:Gfo/Idh/MocA family oxidoreductase [Sedimentisphaerales bacterium]
MSRQKKVSRRRLLKQTAGIAAGAISFPYIVSSSALGNSGSVAPGNRIVMGSIGLGGQGTAKMRAFLGNQDVRIVAVCDVFAERRQKAKDIVDKHYGDRDCSAYNDFRDLLARDDIDAVVIAPQDHWHALMAVAAARAGKDMYCEKPLGVAVTESQAIRKAVRRYGRVFQTGTQQRSDRKFRFACELARNGYLGRLQTVKVAAPGPSYKRTYRKPTTEEPIPPGFDYKMYVGPAPLKHYNAGRHAWPDWYLIWDYCAGFIVNWGVHHLDIANWGCPALTSVPFEFTCTGSYRNDGLTDNINDWQAEFNYRTGLKMTYTDTGNPNKQGCRFEGDEGWVHVNRSGIWAEPASLLEVNIKPDQKHLHESKDHHRDFLDCVRSRRDPVSPVEAGHEASYLGLIAEIATRLKRKLNWDTINERFIDDDEANRMLTRPMRSPWHL